MPTSPRGWFHVPGPVTAAPRSVRLAGADLVLWRDAEGPVLQSAWCPHLGAHLAQGGTVVDGGIRCPFHGFVYARDGRCVATGYGTAPPARARLVTLPLVEHDGLRFAWVGAGPPEWSIAPVLEPGWSPFLTRSWVLPGRPEDVTENSVDLGHFGVVHGYEDFRVTQPPSFDGPVIRSCYRFTRRTLGSWRVRESIQVEVRGLGWSRVDLVDEGIGFRMRLLVLPTPTDTDRLCLTVALSVLAPGRSEGAAAWWRALPGWLTRPVLAPLLMSQYAADVRQDFRVWSTRTRLETPALAEGDGPIGRYRAWVRGFYAETSALSRGRPG